MFKNRLWRWPYGQVRKIWWTRICTFGGNLVIKVIITQVPGHPPWPEFGMHLPTISPEVLQCPFLLLSQHWNWEWRVRIVVRLACASLVKYWRGWFPFYSDVNICECHFSVTARYVKKKLPSLRRVKNNTMWRTFERLGYSYKARRRKAAVAEKHKPARLAYCDWVEKQDQEDLNDWSDVDEPQFIWRRTRLSTWTSNAEALGRMNWLLTDEFAPRHGIRARTFARACFPTHDFAIRFVLG